MPPPQIKQQRFKDHYYEDFMKALSAEEEREKRDQDVEIRQASLLDISEFSSHKNEPADEGRITIESPRDQS